MPKIVYQIIDKGIVISCLVLFLLYPYGLIARYPLGCMLLLLLISLFFRDFRRAQQSKFETRYLFIQLLFWILIVLSFFWSHNSEVSLFDLEIKFSLVLMPLIFYFGGISLLKRKRLILFYYFLFMVIFAAKNLIQIYYELNKMSFSFNWFVSNYEDFTKSCIPELQHHTYLSLYFAIAIFIGLDLFYVPKLSRKWILIKGLISIGIIVLYFFMFIINSRAGILALLITLPLYVFIKTPNRLKIIALTICSLFVITNGCYLINSNPRVKNITKEIENHPRQIVNPQKSDPRLGIWKTSWECIKENFWFGVGNGDAMEIMKTKYCQMAIKDKYYRYLSDLKLYNSHNQYLQTWLTTGIFGLLSLVAILFIPFFRRFNTSYHNLLIACIVFIIFGFMFESMFEAFNGVVIIPFFISFLFYGEKVSSETNSQ